MNLKKAKIMMVSQKVRRQGAQTGSRPEGLGLSILAGCEEIVRNEEYIEVRRATQNPDFLRDHQV